MLRRLVVLVFAGFLTVPLLASVQNVQLKNLEPTDLCVYWILDVNSSADTVLDDLAPVSARFQRLAPGETSRVDLGDQQSLLVVFVPWTRGLEFRSPVRGVLLTSQEMVSGKQFPLNATNLWTSHAAARQEAALSDWGLNVPQFALDGSASEWRSVPETARWPAEVPGSGRPLSVQLRVADQALWMHARLAPSKGQDTVSWVFQGTNCFWELSPRGTEARIWQFFSDGSPGRAVGWRRLVGDELEAWIPLERLAAAQSSLLSGGHWQWRLASGGEKPDNSLLLDVIMGDLP